MLVSCIHVSKRGPNSKKTLDDMGKFIDWYQLIVAAYVCR